ncbi:hypothetical protein D918_01889 [Trichuris suis]|nr:hypothetical protein D918_01889 [Trichuris suis]
MFTSPMKPVGGTALPTDESATSPLRKAQDESTSFSEESRTAASNMLLHETRTVRSSAVYETSSSPTPVRPPRRIKNVTVQQANQMLDEVKQEQG